MKQNFYEPIVQEEQEPFQIRGFRTDIAGTYVLLDDVVTAVRQYAQSLDDAEAGALIHDVANWLSAGQAPPVPVSEPPAAEEGPHEVYGAEEGDISIDVDRVEIYPIETARGTRWHARSIDTGGNILKTTNGSFDQTWVIENAAERWPNVPVHLVQSASDDSMWQERGRKGPSPKRLWAGAST